MFYMNVSTLEYKETFSLFDKEGDGSISLKELGTVLRALGQHPTEADLSDLVGSLEVEGECKQDFCFFLFVDITESVILSKKIKNIHTVHLHQEQLIYLIEVLRRWRCFCVSPSLDKLTMTGMSNIKHWDCSIMSLKVERF
jgi:hypothetical protein